MNVAIIGAGLIGKKRARALPRGMKLVVVCDIDSKRADSFAEEFSCSALYEWEKVIVDQNIDALFICTPNKFASIVAEGSLY